MNEATTNATISIDERMDRHELCVGDRRLCNGGEVIAVHEGCQVLEKTLDVIWRRRNEFGIDGTVESPADPVLSISNHARDVMVFRIVQQGSMDGDGAYAAGFTRPRKTPATSRSPRVACT